MPSFLYARARCGALPLAAFFLACALSVSRAQGSARGEADLTSADPSARASAARLVARERRASAASAVAAALERERVPQVRAALVGALGLAKPDASILPSLERALGDADVAVRLEAVVALSRVADPRAARRLGRVLAEDASPDVRQMAALRLRGVPSALPALARAAAADADPGVRLEAVHTLRADPAPEAARAVRQARADADERVRRAAEGGR